MFSSHQELIPETVPHNSRNKVRLELISPTPSSALPKSLFSILEPHAHMFNKHCREDWPSPTCDGTLVLARQHLAFTAWEYKKPAVSSCCSLSLARKRSPLPPSRHAETSSCFSLGRQCLPAISYPKCQLQRDQVPFIDACKAPQRALVSPVSLYISSNSITISNFVFPAKYVVSMFQF